MNKKLLSLILTSTLAFGLNAQDDSSWTDYMDPAILGEKIQENGIKAIDATGKAVIAGIKATGPMFKQGANQATPFFEKALKKLTEKSNDLGTWMTEKGVKPERAIVAAITPVALIAAYKLYQNRATKKVKLLGVAAIAAAGAVAMYWASLPVEETVKETVKEVAKEAANAAEKLVDATGELAEAVTGA